MNKGKKLGKGKTRLVRIRAEIHRRLKARASAEEKTMVAELEKLLKGLLKDQ